MKQAIKDKCKEIKTIADGIARGSYINNFDANLQGVKLAFQLQTLCIKYTEAHKNEYSQRGLDTIKNLKMDGDFQRFAIDLQLIVFHKTQPRYGYTKITGKFPAMRIIYSKRYIKQMKLTIN